MFREDAVRLAHQLVLDLLDEPGVVLLGRLRSLHHAHAHQEHVSSHALLAIAPSTDLNMHFATEPASHAHPKNRADGAHDECRIQRCCDHEAIKLVGTNAESCQFLEKAGKVLTQSVWWMSRMIFVFSSSLATTSDLHMHQKLCMQLQQNTLICAG